MTPRILLIGALLTALFQTGVLAKIVYDRATLISTGQEIRLRVQGYDPRDLFRGHYVRMRPEISRFSTTEVEVEGRFASGDTVYAELRPGADGFHTLRRLTRERPVAPDGPILKGTANHVAEDGGTGSLQFPFTRFYAARERALELEKFNRDGEMGIILSLQPDGSGLIKGLTLNGRVFYEEPLY